MKAIVITTPGGPESLVLSEVDDPKIKDDEVPIRVSATALNGADVMKRKGLYPPPKGASPYPGLECSGVVEGVGRGVTRWKVGDQAFCNDLGADVGINYKTEDFVARVKEETGGKGVDVILDNIGGSYFQRNLDSLGLDGRLFIIGTQGGATTQLDIRSFGWPANKNGREQSSHLSEVEKKVWPAIAEGKVKPVIYKHFPLAEAAEAHKLMESSQHIGKIMLYP
ncbi:Quinone oxidoreductase PIG3-like protein [Drosera capensis]